MSAVNERPRKTRSNKSTLKTDVVRARIDPVTKIEVEAVLGAVGLSLPDAFRLMISRIIADRRLPFEPLVPTEETIAALRADIAGDVLYVGDSKNLFAVLDAD